MRKGSSFGVMKMFWNLMEVVVPHTANVLNATRLCTSTWSILRQVNFASIFFILF